MTRWANCSLLVSFLAGCLVPDPDSAHVARLDEQAPSLLRVEPALTGNALSLARDGEWILWFSEEMDPRTIRPGIVLLDGNQELPLLLTIAPLNESNMSDVDIEFPVRVSLLAGNGATGSFRQVLRTLLTDLQGNALAEEVSFTVSLQ